MKWRVSRWTDAGALESAKSVGKPGSLRGFAAGPLGARIPRPSVGETLVHSDNHWFGKRFQGCDRPAGVQ